MYIRYLTALCAILAVVVHSVNGGIPSWQHAPRIVPASPPQVTGSGQNHGRPLPNVRDNDNDIDPHDDEGKAKCDHIISDMMNTSRLVVVVVELLFSAKESLYNGDVCVGVYRYAVGNVYVWPCMRVRMCTVVVTLDHSSLTMKTVHIHE